MAARAGRGAVVVYGSDASARLTAGPAAPTVSEVRAALERILSSPVLEASDRRRAFLRFVVEETLAGRAERLKGFTIAVAVFGRDESFDSQSDPVVRLEARRLRRDLDGYYVAAGQRDPLRIVIPKGSYVPRFERQDPVVQLPAAPAPPAAAPEVRPEGPSLPPPEALPSAATRPRRLRLAAGAALAALAVPAILAWYLLGGGAESGADARGPSVVVVSFEALGSNDDSHFLAEGISQELIGNLMRFPGFRLYTLPLAQDGSGTEPATLGRQLGLTYVVAGSVRADPAQVRVATRLIDAQSGRVLWTGTYDRPLEPKALIGVQSELAAEIATAIGQPYGAVSDDLNLRTETADVSSMQSYLCVLRAYTYRRSFSRQLFEPVFECLQEAVERDPDYSDAWAMLGWLHLDAGRFEFAGPENVQREYQAGLAAASRAVELAPNNPLALKAIAAIFHYLGRYDDGEHYVRQALALNPYDPDILAQLGWRLAVRGKFDEGIPLLKRAIERTVNPPGWYFHLVAVDLYLKGEYDEMLAVAERSSVDGTGISWLLIAIACSEAGNPERTRFALEKMGASGPLMRDPAAYFRRHGATDRIVAALVAGLDKARRLAAGP